MIDYINKIILNPSRFYADYMIEKTRLKVKNAILIVQKVYWLCPTYIWLLQKIVELFHYGPRKCIEIRFSSINK